jgi:hypothetical protein
MGTVHHRRFLIPELFEYFDHSGKVPAGPSLGSNSNQLGIGELIATRPLAKWQGRRLIKG